MKKMNELMFTKRMGFIIPREEEKKVTDEMMKAFIVSCAQLGYILSEELKEGFEKLSDENFKKYSVELLDILKESKGADVDMSNFLFPDFPNQTRMTDLETLSELRFAGYIADILGFIVEDNHFRRFIDLGKYAKHRKRTPLELDMEEMLTINLVSENDFYEVCQNLIGSRMALSKNDKKLLEEMIREKSLNIQNMIPSEIPFKETLAWLIELNQEFNFGLNIKFKSFLDVKRAYAALIHEDVTLKTNFKLKNLRNQDRKWLLSCMEENIDDYYESMLESAYKEKNFVTLFWNRIHPENYMKIAPKSVNLLKDIKDGKKFETVLSKVETALKNGYGIKATELLVNNPGEFIRRFAHILSISSVKEGREIMELMKDKISKVDTSVLLNAKVILDNYNPEEIKVAFPKGNVKKAQLFQDKKRRIHPILVKEGSKMIEKALIEKLSEKEKLGKVYIEEGIENFNIPFATRDESKGLRTIPRGSRMQITENTDVLRFFVYKKIIGGGFVDLSISFLDEYFNLVEQCSWTHLKTEMKNLAMHSGDGYNCEEGLSEFIDVDLNQLENYENIRYIALQILSWNQIPFNKMERCFAGVMSRKGMMTDKLKNGKNYSRLTKEEQEKIDFTGEVFEPSTVRYRVDLDSNNLVAMPLLYDTLTREIIYTDLPINRFQKKETLIKTENNSEGGNVIPVQGSITVENIQSSISAACYAMVHLKKPNLKDLILLNLKARKGSLVFDKEDADIIVSEDGTLTPFMRDIITRDWM